MRIQEIVYQPKQRLEQSWWMICDQNKQKDGREEWIKMDNQTFKDGNGRDGVLGKIRETVEVEAPNQGPGQPQGGKKAPNLDVGCQNKLSKESPTLRLDLPKYFYRPESRSWVFFPPLGQDQTKTSPRSSEIWHWLVAMEWPGPASFCREGTAAKKGNPSQLALAVEELLSAYATEAALQNYLKRFVKMRRH